jgi:hypothetical protein
LLCRMGSASGARFCAARGAGRGRGGSGQKNKNKNIA